jgi:CRP/FNR family transcriptional regulator, cyclic AMP receptor protein
MASNRIVEALQQAAIFQGLAPPQLADLARHAERIKFAGGEPITRAGETGDGAYLLVSGVAERMPEPGLAEPPEAVQPGSLIGQLAMLVDHVYGSTVIARERVFCLKVTRGGMHAQMTADPALARHLERHVTQRLLGVARQLREIDSLLQARKPGTALPRPPLAIPAPPAQPTLRAAPAP